MSTSISLLARTIYGESRGEPFDGQLAVAFVILNRCRQRKKTIPEVILEKFQFSCWNRDDPNFRICLSVSEEDPSFLRCLASALVAFSNSMSDPTGGATNYHTIARPTSVTVWPPTWATLPNMVPTTRIGVHQFYREE